MDIFQGIDEILDTMIIIPCGVLLSTGGAILAKLAQLFAQKPLRWKSNKGYYIDNVIVYFV